VLYVTDFPIYFLQGLFVAVYAGHFARMGRLFLLHPTVSQLYILVIPGLIEVYHMPTATSLTTCLPRQLLLLCLFATLAPVPAAALLEVLGAPDQSAVLRRVHGCAS
jgi:hypothetical protein